MPEHNNIVWSAARSYAKAGIFVNPVFVTRKDNGKKDVRPVGLWRDTSSISLADIGAWEQDHPTAGLLIDCGKSGLVVVDCDGPEGMGNWAMLHHGGPPLGIARTPRGQHWYYRADPDHPIGNDQDGKVAPFVDIRGLGGFVFAPPTSDGQGSWEWEVEPGWTAPCPVPAVVIERMLADRSVPASDPTAAPENSSEDVFDDAGKEFTREQAVAYVKAAMTRLGETKRGFNGAINNFAMTCAHFPWLVSQERCGQLMIKALGSKQGWDAPDRDDLATIASAYTATARGKSWVATLVESPEVMKGSPEGTVANRLLIQSPAEMAYWLARTAGAGRMSGFFLRNGEMVHTPRVDETGYVPAPEGGKNGPAEIRAVAAPVLAAKLQYLYECYKLADVKDDKGKATGAKIEVPALFPVEAARRGVDAPEFLDGLRPLAGLTGTPMVRADGSLLDTAGYDEASGYLFLPEQGVAVPAIPERPQSADVARARDVLLGMVADFPFATADDRANYLGLLLTPLLRQLAPPSYKMFGIGAHQPGSGKSLLAEIVSLVHGGVLRSEVPEDEAEWRKQGTTILATTSAPVVVVDNVMGVLKSSYLAGLLTAGREVTDRELGTMRSVTVANDRVWVVTGNNLSIGGDLVRRTITILIDPDTPNPEKRTDFAIADLRGWVTENRNLILWSLLTLVRAWTCAGSPLADRKQSDSYARWQKVIGGILATAEISGEFDQDSGQRAATGGDDDELAGVLLTLYERFGSTPWKVGEILEPGAGDMIIESRDWLPQHVLDRFARSEPGGRKSLGRWLQNRVGRWVTADGVPLVLREVSRDKRKGALWKIEARDVKVEE